MLKRNLVLDLVSIGVLVTAFFHCIPGAHAEVLRSLEDRSTEQLVADAYSTKYGNMLVKEFVDILRASADKDCLRASSLDMTTSAFEAKGRDLLITDGIRVRKGYEDAIDIGKFEQLFFAKAGSKGDREIVTLKADKDVQQLMKFSEAQRMAGLANALAETTGRHSLLSRLGLVHAISPYANPSNTELLEASERVLNQDELIRYIDKHSSAKIERWIELSDAWSRAWSEAVDPAKLHALQYRDPRLGEDLLKLCVLPKQKAKEKN